MPQYTEPMAINEQHDTDGTLLLQVGEPMDRAERRKQMDAAIDSILDKDARLLERLADA